jgi:hypothetical protein
MLTKEEAFKGVEQLASEVGRSILQRPIESLLSSYQVGLTGLSQAAPISILPNRTLPLNETSIVLAHNAYNSLAEGALWPNQQPSITELLDIGIRGLEFDVHWNNGAIRLCHELCAPICLGYNRRLEDALVEVNSWLQLHPNETIILKLEDYLKGAPRRALFGVVNNTLNTSSIFTPVELSSTFNNNWPSIDQINGLGKQLIIMPQNTHSEPLFFYGDWGKQFKNNFNSSTIAKVRNANLTIVEQRLSTKLFEVGEDRTFFGTVGDYARNIPLIGQYIPVAAQMTKEEIRALRTSGVNIISLDNVGVADSRLTSSMTISDMRDSAYILIPAAVALAAFTPREQGEKTLGTASKRAFVQLLVASTLPDEGRVLYNSVDTGISAYNESAALTTRARGVMTTMDQVRAVSHSLASGIGKGAETIARIGLSNVTGQSTPSTLVGAIGQTVANFIVVKIILDPPLGAVKGAYQGFTDTTQPPGFWSRTKAVMSGAADGFVRGIESSMFGLVSFPDPNQHHVDPDMQELTNMMGQLNINHLRRTEKEYLTELFGNDVNEKGFNLQSWLHKQAPEHKDLLNDLIKVAILEAGQAPLPQKSQSTDEARIEVVGEQDHIKQHGSNIEEIIKSINKGKDTVIALERKQAGNNLGMTDVILMAKIIQYNEKTTEENKIKLLEEIKSSPIYQDALLYLKAQEISQEKGIKIQVVGIEGKGLEHTKESPQYNQGREEHMKKAITELATQGSNVKILVGEAHKKELTTHAQKILDGRSHKSNVSEISH